MKKITKFFFLIIFTQFTFGQGTDILSSEQFCSGTSLLTFNNVFGGTDPTDVGCLGSIPNASYFFMEIDQPGDLIFDISQEDTGGTPIDVDFIVWGPFTDLADANANISYTDCPTCPNNTANPSFYPYAPDFISDCSFDPAPTETMNILNAMQGEIYVVLITNFNGAQGTIDFQQTGGNGTTTCASEPVCGSQYLDQGGPTGPYSLNESTTIFPYFAGGTVSVDFTTLDIPDTGDVLTVYNGPNNTFPVLGTVTATGSFTSNTVGNPTGAITFELVTDGDAVVGSGWVADITCYPPPPQPTCGFTFYDSGGATGDYNNDEYETYTFFPDTPGDIVTATFTAFDLDSPFDDLFVYDGPNSTYPLLGVYSGNIPPGPFTSSDTTGALTFVFVSSSFGVASGWAADLTCATPICGTTFYDSGGSGGNYSANESETTTFFPDFAGELVSVTFTNFNTELGTDQLVVYDGPDATFPVIGTFSGTTIPGPFTSSDPSGALTFVFTSNGSNQNSGWEADISCVPPPTCLSSFFDSGGAGGDYGTNESQTYTFFPDTPGDVIMVTFNAFELESCCDALLVYDGPDATFPLIGTFTGFTVPGPFTSTDPTGALTFVFNSDSSVQYSGWEADISCFTPVCGTTFYDSGGAGGNYSANESETTTFFPDSSGDTVTATFTNFSTELGVDELIVYDGPDATFPVLGTYSGSSIPGPFTSTDPSGALTFVFTSNSSNNNVGWAADITCSPSTLTCGSTFYDSGGAGGDYSTNENTTTTFFPDVPGDAVTATFTTFGLESCCDALLIYDGPDATYPLLGSFSGFTIPGPFTSSDASGALTFVFTSDSSVQYDGWAADLSCAPYVPPAVCGTTFYDSGGPSGDYSSNEFSVTTLTPDIPGTTITATFTSFNLESCCDELLVYDGPDATFPLLGTFTGNTLPGPFTSTDPSGALTFVFDSDSSVQLSGWAADITCTSICNLIITDSVYPIGADECTRDYTELTTNAPVPAPSVIVYSESFDGPAIPAGWTANNGAPSADWIISNTNNAGGTANEAMLDWITGSDVNIWTLTSGLINIAGQSNLQASFKQELNAFLAPGYTLYFETSLNGSTWTTQWSYVDPPDFSATTNVDISALDGNNNLYIRFRLDGDSNYLFYWSIDDIEITADGAPMEPEVTWSPLSGLYLDSGLTTPYTGGNMGTVYAAPNGSVTYTATDSNTCTDTVTVDYNRKVWNGSVNENWYIDANWTPVGVPTIFSCVVIPDILTVPDYPIADKAQTPIPFPPLPATARNLTLESNSYLEIDTDTELIVDEWVNVQNTGIFNLKSSGSLVQIDDSAINTGEIHVQRSPNYDESAVAGTEYVYWSTPVANFGVNNVSPGSSQIYEWEPSVAGNGAGNHGQWNIASGAMTTGKGYIIRGLGGTPTTIPASVYGVSPNTALFSGNPNNGVISIPIYRGAWNGGNYPGMGNTATNEDDNWNLIGNPYPSAISANAFTDFNTNINGTIYLWPHGSTYSDLTLDPFYEDFVYNYDGNDYIEYNNTGSNPPGTNDLFISSGQAFFVLMSDGASSGTSITFNNNMREVLPTYRNDIFFRAVQDEVDSADNSIERHRIWLDLLGPGNVTNSVLIGYVEGATNGFDRLYDGYDLGSDDTSFYSLLDTEYLSIQGRTLPFLQEDQVPLGLVSNQSGSHSIAINSLDGLFIDTAQEIYIEDTELNIIHDIKSSPYTFVIDEGIHNTRFILRYTNESLSLNDLQISELTILAPKGEYIKVNSDRTTIREITLYDLLGRRLFNKINIESTEFIIKDHNFSDGTYIVTVTLEDGGTKSQKIVLKH